MLLLVLLIRLQINMKRFFSFFILCAGLVAVLSLPNVFAQTVVSPQGTVECDINNDGTCNNGSGNIFSWTPDVINGTRPANTTTTTATTQTTGGFTKAELDFCKKVTKSNASKCCGEKPIGTTKQCKSYVTDPKWAAGADALYCLNIDEKNFNYCCGVLSIDTNKCNAAQEQLKTAATNVAAVKASGGLLYSKETVPGVTVPLIGLGQDASFFCATVTSDTANYCCNTTKLGNAQSCEMFGITRATQQGEDPERRSECSIITNSNSEWCCVLNEYGPADQCKSFKENSYFATKRKEECKQISKTNGEWCCVLNNYGPKEDCDAFIETTGGSGTVVGGSQGTTVTAQNGGYLGEGSAAQSQASALELKTCSAIKFITLFDIVVWAKCIIISALLPLIFTLAFVTFIWGVFRFMYSEDKNKKQEAKNFILWGIIGLFVMVSLWGIIAILGQTFGIRSVVPFLQTEYLSKNKTSTGGAATTKK